MADLSKSQVCHTNLIETAYNVMADNFLERHRRDYEERKEAWLRNKKHMPKVKRKLQRPDDEGL